MDSEKGDVYNILIDVEKRTTDAEKKNERCWIEEKVKKKTIMDSEKGDVYNILIDVEKRTTDAEKKNERCWSDGEK